MPRLTSGNSTVDEMAQISIKGNVIPQEWFKHVLRKNGKPHLLAILILGDVVYWHRPTEIRDENTGYIIGWKKKFIGNVLQKSYKFYSNMFGESKDSVKAAFDVLVNVGVIERSFDDVEHPDGTISNNVMYIKLIPSKLREITFGTDDTPTDSGMSEVKNIDIPENNSEPPLKFSGSVPNISDEVVQNNGGGGDSKVDTLPENVAPYPLIFSGTNTYNNQENLTNNNIKSIYPSFTHSASDGTDKTYEQYQNIIAGNISYDRIKGRHPANKKLVERILKVLTDAVCSKEPYTFIAKKNRSLSEIRERYLGLEEKHIEHVLSNLPEDDADVALKDKFLMAYLFNAPDTIGQICKTKNIRPHKGKDSCFLENCDLEREAWERELLSN